MLIKGKDVRAGDRIILAGLDLFIEGTEPGQDDGTILVVYAVGHDKGFIIRQDAEIEVQG